MNAIARACQIVGGQKKLAVLLSQVGDEITASAINQMCSGLRQVPAGRCPDIERVTNGAVTCEELRPDLAEQWSYLRGTAKEAA